MSGSWSTGGNLGTARYDAAGGGNASDAFCVAGCNSDYESIASSEKYNGTSWSSGGNIAAAKDQAAGGGNSSNAICMSGRIGLTYQTSCQEYNGTSWGSGGSTAIARAALTGGGNSTDAFCTGGWAYDEETEEENVYGSTEEYNGTSWSSGGDLNTPRINLAGGGNSSNAICMGGSTGSVTEEYNGTSWSSGGNLVSGRDSLAGGGNATAAICMGGNYYAGGVDNVETYDGSAWGTTANLLTARHTLSGGGTPTTAIVMGGDRYGILNGTEEYTGSTDSYYLARGIGSGIFIGLMD